MNAKTFICNSADLPEGSSRGYQIERDGADLAVILIRKRGQAYAYHNLCPHVAIPLEWVEHEFLTSDGSLIQCANHGALFVIENGQCVSGPCAGQALRALSICEVDGGIYLHH
ncbi:Rieske (2Fe-2S) protein [Gilvimarinus sp. DA14]|uniref:Rieske (2Fe-2S) protein n=1 Tax=Gilvimarinus sp. DA14 TaxID=2956798 RepID=UPI0020B8871D|nr:Rieske (2Fe-2S) protein [Gilvimarinus sp. DA14]UTF59961.1 Rieske (2Fe-2S) protein [Gilvimarinus sp. DA14]